MKKLIIFIFLFLSCSLFKKEEEPIPLEIGNWWAYRFLDEDYVDTLKIIGKLTVNGIDHYVLYEPEEAEVIGFLYYKNDYLWFFYPGEEPEKFFPIFPEIGKKWGYEKKLEVGDWDGDGINDSIWEKEEYTIISKENINVPAGYFKDCYQVRYHYFFQYWYSIKNRWEDYSEEYYFWVKMGVGIVKGMTWLDYEETKELVGYQVK